MNRPQWVRKQISDKFPVVVGESGVMSLSEEWDAFEAMQSVGPARDAARAKQARAALGLVRRMAKTVVKAVPRLAHRYDDFIEVGLLPVVLAMDTFNPDLGRWSTHVCVRIRAAMYRAIRHEFYFLHIPEHTRKPSASDHETAKVLMGIRLVGSRSEDGYGRNVMSQLASRADSGVDAVDAVDAVQHAMRGLSPMAREVFEARRLRCPPESLDSLRRRLHLDWKTLAAREKLADMHVRARLHA
jgi:hypothetical protein